MNEAIKGLTRAQESGYPDVIASMHHVTSKILALLALLETRRDDRKQFLEKALKHRLESRENFRHSGLETWNTGIFRNYLANIHSQLADLVDDSESKRTDLGKAISEKESAIEICTKVLSSVSPEHPQPHVVWIAERQREHGALLEQLKELTHEDAELKRASDAYERAAESYQRAETPSWAGECHWKSAEIYDTIGEHLKASEKFLLASEHYKLATDKIPELSTLYREYAEYLEAWSHIEKARHHHKREEYGLAQKHYEEAAKLHQSSENWAFLAPNYSAWASIEHGEELSRREQSKEALSAFQNALELFHNTEQSLQRELDKLQSQEELKMVTKLVKATRTREQYCQARILVEEAKMLDSKGDHSSSSERFASAAEIFERLSQQAESETDSRELRTIATLSLAWQRMSKAEADVSPELYVEASTFFERAKEMMPREKGKMIALGHSHLCLAMEQGTRLADTGERAFHSKALQHLEGAAKYYLKAGFQSASAYADACRSLFDAYVYMGEVSRTEQPEGRVKLYALAGKVLQASADLFHKAGQEAKVEQVQRLLQNVKEKRELELSLVEVLRAPEILSSTSAFTTPSPTFERAVGLDSFEHANVQANLIVGQRSVKVGEDVELEIEMVNAGRAPAQLVKVEELIPEGFELHRRPEAYRVEESHLIMKGRRLDPLKMEEVKLVLRPRVQGRFTLKPRILYLDNLGRYRSHEPDPVEVTVKELGISGWIKGS